MGFLFKALGAIGLLFITVGIFKRGTGQGILFAIGGAFLLAYSIYLRDPVFIPLQIIFTASSLYEIYLIKKSKYKI